jgi:hypothetical protein
VLDSNKHFMCIKASFKKKLTNALMIICIVCCVYNHKCIYQFLHKGSNNFHLVRITVHCSTILFLLETTSQSGQSDSALFRTYLQVN